MRYIIKYAIQYYKRGIFLFAVLLGGSIYFSSCVKQDKLYSPEEGTIYMPQAFQDRGNLSLFKLDSPQTVYFGIAYGGFKSAEKDINAMFEVDTSLVAQYNIDNAYLGNHYVVLPDSSYTISGLSTVLKADSTSSAPLSLSITTSKLALGTHYLLPVKLTSISSGKFDSSLSVTYFKIDTLNIRSRDLTAQAEFSFNYDDAPDHNDAKESAIHLVDNDLSTKYLLFNYQTDMYVQLKFPSPTVINGYTITSGNDAPQRDPKDWDLAASNDGTNWTVIDSRTDQVFSGRKQTIQFNTNNNSAYSYYRLNITANNNGNTGLFQCTEWRLLQFY